MGNFKRLFRFFVQPRQLLIYFVLAMIVPNVALCFTEHYSLGASLCNVLIPASVFAYLCTLRRRPGVMVWVLFPFVFLAAFQLVLLYLFGNSIIAVDMFLNLVTTNASEALELLDNLVPAVLTVFILYVPLLVFAAVSIRQKTSLTESLTVRLRRVALGGMLAGGAVLGLTYLAEEDYEVKVDLFPLNVCYNCYLAIERTEDVANYAETSKDFSFNVHSTHDAEQPEIYLLVIGETSRACNWGLYGYERNTTPKLQQQTGLVHFTDVLTQSNTTHKSVPMLLSLASAENYDRIYEEKSVITAFKEAGFYTAYFSNQKYNHSFIDIFGKEADTSVFLKEENKSRQNIYDGELVGMVDNLLKQGHRRLFIVLHTYGSHFNYKERYSKSVAKFLPDDIMEASPKNRESLVNAYDNTILQTDAFLSNLIGKLQQQDKVSAMIYTSDHGEDIFDDDRHLFLHSSPVPSYYQLHVPFIIWTSEKYRKAYPKNCSDMEDNHSKAVSSNASVVPTLLELAGLSSPYCVDSLSLCNDRYGISQRFYLNDHNLPKPYNDIGLDREDFDLFEHHGISHPQFED